MTKDEVERIVTEWQARLGLSHWDIRVVWDKEVEEGCEASIKVSDDYEQASIRIQQIPDEKTGAPHYEGWTDRYANETIVHELLHVFEIGTRLSVAALEPSVTGVVSKAIYELTYARYMHEAENWIDRLAKRFVDLAGLA